MLIQFSVENYKSFRGEAVLSLLPSKDTNHESNVSTLESTDRVLNTIAIYGANAAGKTNLFKALTTSILLIRKSNQLQKNDRLDGIVPFLFDSEMSQKPTSFEFVFSTNGVKYIYGFSATQVEIISEYLYAYYSVKPTTIFEREGDQYKFPKDKRMLEQLAEKNTPNKLFISTATAWNYDRTEPAYSWFERGINTYPEYERLHPIAFEQFEKESPEKIHQFVIELLRESDINISDYKIKSEPINEQEWAQLFGPLFSAAKDSKLLEGKKTKCTHGSSDIQRRRNNKYLPVKYDR
jgi:AAA15 family ATPase/GTPase